MLLYIFSYQYSFFTFVFIVYHAFDVIFLLSYNNNNNNNNNVLYTAPHSLGKLLILPAWLKKVGVIDMQRTSFYAFHAHSLYP